MATSATSRCVNATKSFGSNERADQRPNAVSASPNTGPPHDLREHQPHRIQQAQEQKSERNQQQNVDFARNDMPVPEPLHHVAQLRVRRPIEAAHALLLGGIVV